MMKERWKEIYDGYYKISNKGRLKRNKPGPATYVGKILKPKCKKKKSAYPFYILSINNNQINKGIHKLVSETFLGPCPKGKEVNHKNPDKKCKYYNYVWNLEYVTHLENIKHSVENNLNYVPRLKGEDHGMAKLNKQQVKLIRFVYKTKLFIQQEIADIFEVDRGTISDIVTRRNWTHI